MTSVVETAPRLAAFDADASARMGQEQGDPAWLAELRTGAANRLATAELPDGRRSRTWKYTSLKGFEPWTYRPAEGRGWPGSPDELLKAYNLEGTTGPAIALRNGDHLFTREGDGVTITSPNGGSAEAAVEGKLGGLVPPEATLFTLMHYAYLQGAVVINVQANAEPETVRIARRYDGASTFSAPHTLIVTAANSRVTVIEDHQSTEDDLLVLPVVEVYPGPGSQVTYVSLHRWGAQTRVFSEQTTLTDRDSTLRSLSVVAGGLQVKSHLTGLLEGRGSASEVLGVALGAGHEYSDFYTLQDHIGPDTRSDLLIKAALEDESQSVYYGLTRVGLGARNADANQENRNLLLSKKAKADSDPVLEILTNDVIRVSHGATAGPVDEEQLYYMESRGISREVAEDMLVRAFVGQVLDRVPDVALRQELEAIVDAKLGRTSA
jgi:Fe-S cluster assembly protein SufD